MLSAETQSQITTIWDKYIEANKPVVDTRGRVINDIDTKRCDAILEIRGAMDNFLRGGANLGEFKTWLDGYNKRNNLWGFTATKGQMFFNQLVKTSEPEPSRFMHLITGTIREPESLDAALRSIARFESYVKTVSEAATDKRKVPNPGSTCYFLSYFWQIFNKDKWPIFYTSLTKSFADLRIWEDHDTQADAYREFIDLNDEIRELLSSHAKQDISYWDIEHAFWAWKGSPHSSSTAQSKPRRDPNQASISQQPQVELRARFELSDYLIPRVANLVELGEQDDRAKAAEFEKLVAEIFGLLDFDIKMLGQGSGRNPDAILRFREENTAFIVDAKAYRGGYSMGVDDRAIKEYIAHHCPQLRKEGYTKIGFIIVSNSFKSNLDNFINEITWNTDIKRFILLTSEALLYLLAYKTRDKRDLPTIIDRLVTMGNLIDAGSVIEKFDDV